MSYFCKVQKFTHGRYANSDILINISIFATGRNTCDQVDVGTKHHSEAHEWQK
jgi:hypothetical protein